MDTQAGRSRPLPPALAALGIAVAIVVTGVLLWRVTGLHSYIIGIGAGMAAFLAPLPGMVEPQTKRKWQIAIVLSAVIGLGVWFGADDMASEKNAAEQRLDAQRQSFQAALRSIPSHDRAPLILSAANSLKEQYHSRRFVSVIDLAQVVLAIDADNGHALYYAGEGYRCLRDRTDMREALQHYLAEATRSSESLDGDAAQCYSRPHGYCAERTAWINHLMANDYHEEAASLPKSRRADALLTSFRYEHHVLQIRRLGFYGMGTVESSCALLQQVRREMLALRYDSIEIDADLRSLRCSASPQ